MHQFLYYENLGGKVRRIVALADQIDFDGDPHEFVPAYFRATILNALPPEGSA